MVRLLPASRKISGGLRRRNSVRNQARSTRESAARDRRWTDAPEQRDRKRPRDRNRNRNLERRATRSPATPLFRRSKPRHPWLPLSSILSPPCHFASAAQRFGRAIATNAFKVAIGSKATSVRRRTEACRDCYAQTRHQDSFSAARSKPTPSCFRGGEASPNLRARSVQFVTVYHPLLRRERSTVECSDKLKNDGTALASESACGEPSPIRPTNEVTPRP
ncbi:hypothetical protein AWB78_05626 [Caballeronia calidae]|uniref:Uncharacterized protein n=1 Tax=Caballeronia calidae TaxID=1777139 RepID=A0A158DWT7_9BURK|nr:hypothetical protein AWB78_05626 [Caballeronia calidae]